MRHFPLIAPSAVYEKSLLDTHDFFLFSFSPFFHLNDIQYQFRRRSVAMFGEKLKLDFECNDLRERLLKSQVRLCDGMKKFLLIKSDFSVATR